MNMFMEMSVKERRQYFVAHVTTSHKVVTTGTFFHCSTTVYVYFYLRLQSTEYVVAAEDGDLPDNLKELTVEDSSDPVDNVTSPPRVPSPLPPPPPKNPIHPIGMTTKHLITCVIITIVFLFILNPRLNQLQHSFHVFTVAYSAQLINEVDDMPLDIPQIQTQEENSSEVISDEVLFDPWCDPSNPRVIQFQDISAAAFKIKSGIMMTPCTRSHISSMTGCQIFFKKDFLQYTGSFKASPSHDLVMSQWPCSQEVWSDICFLLIVFNFQR